VVINAIQAVGQDGKVEVGGRLDPDGGALWIEVLDSGPGIPADKCSAIFEPFFTTKEDGTGLGLWIVQQIVSAHGGGVFAGNLPEGGAVLTLRLPLRRREAMHE
jgi:signal transduction histidine kinase